ncbi:hypothetical protein H6F88_30085 [Oculatella sp. FACHB-28]|uniref:hypothetical protein n=1 Tax=Cyanophyceae TaxID=3028117 RepID=UPI00168785AD|nr:MULTISPECIES: hypothetical protein [Cyanophyceae]MBD1997295.1 hypothetical protein [Leptolyngbya sp. FACHB-541]MBD2060197.1 hypothetical protein [Oculatella sp. FACHB-28]
MQFLRSIPTVFLVAISILFFTAAPAAAARGPDPCEGRDRGTGINREELSSLINQTFPIPINNLNTILSESPTCWINQSGAAYRAKWDPQSLLIVLVIDRTDRTAVTYDFYFIGQ